MIIKHLQIPLKLQALNACKGRLLVDHPKTAIIHSDWARRNAGHNGEMTIYYHLTNIDEDFYFIFHDLRLKTGDYFFQIDFLLITSRFILIIEAKNISGELVFDQQGQLIRTINDKTEGFSDPVAQAQSHQRCLRKWLAAHHFAPLPIDYLVTISQPSTIIKMERTDPQIRRRVRPAPSLYDFIQSLNQTFRKEMIDPKALKKLSKLLLKKHTPLQPDLLKEYNLTEKDILTGVHCPKCAAIPMVPLKGIWKCLTCYTYSKDAYTQAIEDYFLLISPTITNSQLREFLHLSSIQKARRILNSMNLTHERNNKARVYFRKK